MPADPGLKAAAVEVMARALWSRYTASKICKEDHRDIEWDTLVRWGQDRPLIQDLVDTARAEARDALTALLALLSERGWVVVPREPQPEMVAAFWRTKNAGHRPQPAPVDTSDYAAYRAMLSAAPNPFPEEPDNG